jgi:DNA primase
MSEIISVITNAGVDLKKIGDGVWRGFCPFHKDGKTPNFTVYEKTNSFYCFSCGTGGNVLTFIVKFYKVSFDEARKKYYSLLNYGDLCEKVNSTKHIDYKKILNKTVSLWIKNKFADVNYDYKKVYNVMGVFDIVLLNRENFTKEEFDSLLINFEHDLARCKKVLYSS